jgi:hypothetical protein
VTDIIELYRMVENGVVYTQTSSDAEQTHLGDTYDPMPMKRTEPESKTELQRGSLEIETSIANPVARAWMQYPVESNVTLTIYQKTPTGTFTFWKGQLAHVKGDTNGDKITLVFENFNIVLGRPGLRPRFYRLCRHVLYGRGCFLNHEDHKLDGITATAVSGYVVTVSSIGGAPDQRYRGGMLKGPGNVVRFIVSQVGTQVTLSRPFPALANAVTEDGPQSVTLYKGCAHTTDDCNDEFDNLPNHGGFPLLPTRNPMGGQSIM